LQKLEAANTQVLGVTMDGFFANKAWTNELGTNFPMLSDIGGDVTRRYGIFNPQTKAARRATFIIDKTGKVVEIQLDQEALDSANAVNACERHKLKG
jgi:alkyl hydroperoxide reductase subunit AhpC